MFNLNGTVPYFILRVPLHVFIVIIRLNGFGNGIDEDFMYMSRNLGQGGSIHGVIGPVNPCIFSFGCYRRFC